MKRHWEKYGKSYQLIDAQGWLRAIIYKEINWNAVGILGTGFETHPLEFIDPQKRRLMRKMERMLTNWEKA